MKIKITPPKIPALPENFIPTFLPIIIPKRQIINVTTAIIKTQIKAEDKSYSEIVNPTESASMLVATP